MALLITGGRGFLGRHLAARAAERGLTVHLAEGDLREAETARRAVAGSRPEAIVHLATVARRPGDPWELLADELAMTGAVLRAAAEIVPAATVLVPGSAAHYGMGAGEPLREDAPQRPVSAYGALKCVVETACRDLPRPASLRLLLPRVFNLVGPGQPPYAPVAGWAQRVARGERTIPVGNLDVVRDFLDVRDAADALLALLERGAEGVVNVGAGHGVRLRDLFDLLGAEPEPDPALARPHDPPVVVADTSRLREATGWRPAVPLERSVADLLAEEAACAR
jgi:GDP-4-dehydro-6-deoxy-D-mannose reductase